MTLDSITYQNSLKHVDSMITNFDNHERHILHGAKHSPSTLKPVLVVEFTPLYSASYLDESKAIETNIQSLGYSAYTDGELFVPSLTQDLKLLPDAHSAMIFYRAQ